MIKANLGCGPHFASGWVNLDVIYSLEANIRPDALATFTRLPFRTGSVTHLYAGHCLEHLPIPHVLDEAMREVQRVLHPTDGQAAFVCPDVYRAIDWFKRGKCDWSLVDACLEGPDDGIDPANAWNGCFHAWNAHEQRLLHQVQRTFPEARAVDLDSQDLDVYPCVSRVGWQCAVVTS